MTRHPQMSPGRSRLPGTLRRVLAAGSWWVPRARRGQWRREWEAEIVYAANTVPAQRSSGRLLRRALWSHLDALWIRKEELTMTRLLADIRLASRSLRRSPGFAVVAILTLALGIGANTAIFSVVNGVLLKPLAFPESERLLSVNFTAPGLGYDLVPFSDDFYLAVRDQQRTLDSLGISQSTSVNIVGDGDPVRVAGANITPSVLDVLRTPPALGRPFTREDAQPGAAPVVLIAHEFWVERFGGNASIVGSQVEMDGRQREIIGVMPPGLTYPGRDTRVWQPLIIDEANPRTGAFSSPGIARMAPGATIESVSADLRAIVDGLFAANPDEYPPSFMEEAQFGTNIVEAKELVVGDVRSALLVILGTVGMVLLIACANVANLFLVRAESRQREVTLRAALGAQSGDLARFYLAESLLLALAGGTVGVIFAAVAVTSFTGSAPVAIPRLNEIGIDATVLLFTLGVSLTTGLLFGVVPLIRRPVRDLAAALRDGGRSATAAAGTFSARNLLVVAQVALALVLLVGSGLMIRSFNALRHVNPGFESDGVLVVEVMMPAAAYPEAGQRADFLRTLRDRIGALPGVVAVGGVDDAPMGGGRNAGSIDLEDFPDDSTALPPLAEKKDVVAGFFETMKIPLIEGRYLRATDGAGEFRGAVVSENFARHWWPEGGALGRRVREDPSEEWWEIVGVVGNVHYTDLETPAEESVYYPMLRGPEEAPFVSGTYSMTIRTSGAALDLVGPVRAIVRELDPRLPLSRAQRMQEMLDDSMSRTSFTLLMLGIAGAVALLLGAIGIYGVISYVVSQRTQEIGVRIALGASRGSVQGIVVRRGMVLIAIGVVLGVGASLAAGSSLASLLYEIDPADPVTYAVVVLGLTGTALLASWLPALRASRVDPVVALRAD